MIIKRSKGYYAMGDKGKALGGPYKTKARAEKRITQVKAVVKAKVSKYRPMTTQQRLAMETERELDAAEKSYGESLRSMTSRMGFLFIVDQQDTTCEECMEHDGEMFAYDDPDMPKLPIHPNCNCRLEPISMGDDEE